MFSKHAVVFWGSLTLLTEFPPLDQAPTARLERVGTAPSPRPNRASVLARLGQPSEAWQALENDLGRGLLDELAARQDRRLTAAERTELRELTGELENLDKLVESAPGGLDKTERAKRFEDLKRQRELASIALGELHTNLTQRHGALAGQVAKLDEIQAALPPNAALVTWVDIPRKEPNAAEPDGQHWGVVVRARGVPAWVAINGTGRAGLWTDDDLGIASRCLSGIRTRPSAGAPELQPLVQKLRSQRLEPLAKALGATPDGLPAARRLIVLPSPVMAGFPVDVLLGDNDARTVSYVPSATVFKYLREQPRAGRPAGLLALGDPACSPPAPGTRTEVEAIARLFKSGGRPSRVLLATDASEEVLGGLVKSGDLGRFGFIHFATRGLIDQTHPARSALILTQTGLPDPLDQALSNKPVYDGRLTVREIQRSWNLSAELVTFSAGETALGRYAGGDGFVGFTQALLGAGARSMCLSLWTLEQKSTSLLMTRFYQNLLGKRAGLQQPMPKAEALQEAKKWLRNLTVDQVDSEWAALERSDVRPLAKEKSTSAGKAAPSNKPVPVRPYEHPYYWAAFVLIGDPD